MKYAKICGAYCKPEGLAEHVRILLSEASHFFRFCFNVSPMTQLPVLFNVSLPVLFYFDRPARFNGNQVHCGGGWQTAAPLQLPPPAQPAVARSRQWVRRAPSAAGTIKTDMTSRRLPTPSSSQFRSNQSLRSQASSAVCTLIQTSPSHSFQFEPESYASRFFSSFNIDPNFF